MNKQLPVFILVLIALVNTGIAQIPAKMGTGISVKSVLDKYATAMGGEAIKEIKTIVRKGTLIRGVAGKVPFEMKSQSDGKWYYKQIFAYGDVVCYGTEGKTAWVQDTKSINTLPEEEKLDLQFITDIQMPLKISEVFSKIAIKQLSGDSIKLDAVTSNGIKRELVFDKTSGLLLSVGDIIFDNYQQVENISLPHKIYIGDYSNGQLFRLRMDISDIKLNPEISDVEFMQPTCSLHPEKSQLYTLRKQVEVSEEALNACVGTYQSVEDETIRVRIIRQGSHLMYESPGSPRTEIKPMSETDYFIRFWNQEFHFVKDSSGKIACMEMGANRSQKYNRIK